jgi:polar amino acid transport system substrate-binding protein
MRIVKSIVVLLIMAGLMAGYAPMAVAADEARAASTLDRIMAKKELVVGTAASMPPLNMVMKDGQVAGMDIDLARLFSEALEINLTLKQMPFNNLLGALQSGQVDMVLSGMTITPTRNLKVAFVGPYLIAGKSILTKKALIESMSEPSKINTPDKVLVALKGSTSQTFAEKVFPKAKLSLMDNYDQAVSMVIQNKAHAMVADISYCQLSVYRYPDAELVTLKEPLSYEPLGIAIPANDFLLFNCLQNFLNTVQKDGSLGKIVDRWFKDGSWVSQMR